MFIKTKDGTEHHYGCRRGGEYEGAWYQPKCSCGWNGKITYAWEDKPHYYAQDQFEEHIREVEQK